MKKLSKNKFTKLFAIFLGASTILTPIATLISCEQINKTPIEKQNPNNTNQTSNDSGNQTNTTTDTTTISGVTITTTKKWTSNRNYSNRKYNTR